MHYFRICFLIPFILHAAPISKLKVGDEILSGLKHHTPHNKLIQKLIHDIEVDHEVDLHLYHLKPLKKIQFTAYFAPIVDVKSQPDDQYRFAIYQKPPEKYRIDGKFPTREQIDGEGILKDQNLEIAWTKNPLDVFWMQIQGSAMAKFEDGSTQLLAFDGKNGHPYVSIGKKLIADGHIPLKRISLQSIEKWFADNPDQIDHYLFQNPSYVFFKRQKGLPKGAAGFELTPRHSVAVDPKIFPFGSVLLIKLGRNDFRLVVAQDSGSAITGPHRMDLYLGIGDEARKEAGPVRQFGEAWLLSSKTEQDRATQGK